MLRTVPASPMDCVSPQHPRLEALPVYQTAQRCSSRFCCRAFWFFSMLSISFFTAGGAWILSLAMNSLGIQMHRDHREERRHRAGGREGMRPMVRTFRI